jgi:hypothetical protein
MVAGRLESRKPGSSSTFTSAAVTITRGNEPSILYLRVDDDHYQQLWLLTRPGKIASAWPLGHAPNIPEMILHPRRLLQSAKKLTHPGLGVKPKNGYQGV